jgi:hypothetical protein
MTDPTIGLTVDFYEFRNPAPTLPFNPRKFICRRTVVSLSNLVSGLNLQKNPPRLKQSRKTAATRDETDPEACFRSVSSLVAAYLRILGHIRVFSTSSAQS